MLYHPSYNNKEKINQSLKECVAFRVKLDRLLEYSYSFKTTLSETLDNSTDKELIAEAETFHNLIIVRDEYIKDIAADIKKQEKELHELLKEPDGNQWIKQQEKLRNEISHLEKDFVAMKETFYRKFLKADKP